MTKKLLVITVLFSLIPIVAVANDENYRSDQDQEMLRIQRERQNENTNSTQAEPQYQGPPAKNPRACKWFGAFDSSLCDTEDETE